MRISTSPKNILLNCSVAITLLLLAAIGAAAAIPGSHRALAPEFYGLKQMDHNVFIDSTIEADKAIKIIDVSKQTLNQFFGELQSAPRIIICSKQDCAQRFGANRFGESPRGITYGFILVKIAPKGFNPMIITHELFHAELHKRMGLFGMVEPVIPVWFNEGVATLISKDQRYKPTYSDEEIEWIKNAQSYFGDWGDHIKERGWKDTYGSAMAAVKNIEAQKGAGALRKIIDRVTLEGQTFEGALAE